MKEQFFINESENLRLRRCKESFQDFINLARIGRGGYGNVRKDQIVQRILN